MRATCRHLSGDGEHNGVVDGVHQVVDGSLRLIQLNKGGISRYLCVQLINPLLNLPYKIGIVIPVPCYLLDSLALNLVLGQHTAQIFVLLVCLLRPVHTDKARIVLERLAKHHRHFKHIGRVKANALGLFVLNHGIINPFGSVVFCLYLTLRGCQPDSPLFRTGQRGRHARYAPG